MGTLIDLTATAQSFLPFINQLNNLVSQTIGLEVHWMRAIPHAKSEDVIFHEYTLHDVECPKSIKVVTSNTSYNPGNFSIDYFGINYEAPLEISVDKKTWQSVYGPEVMPQQHDIVYVDILNCLYEVATSTIEYGFVNQEVGFKMQLTKWNPRANVRLNPSVEETINDLTVGEAELFNEEIANQVADIIDDPETSNMLNTSLADNDLYKTRDLDAIENQNVTIKDNIVAKSFYDLRKMDQSIIYRHGDLYDISDKNNYRYFSCWFKLMPEDNKMIDIGSLSQENGNYYLAKNVSQFSNGEEIQILRGNYLTMHAIVNQVRLVNGQLRYQVTFNNSEYRDVVKKITNWNSNLGAIKTGAHALLLGRTNGVCNFNISLLGNNTLFIKFGDFVKRLVIGEIPKNQWACIGLNLGPNSNISLFTKDADWNLKLQNTVNLGSIKKSLEVGEFYIPRSDTQLTNIRYYKTDELVSTEIMEKDLNWCLVKNDSRTIINDNAMIPNTSPFISEQR